jgi:hypothetical protein
MAGDDWSRDEVEATVGNYFEMRRDEHAGLRHEVRCRQNGWKGGEPYRGCVSRVKRGYR